MWQVVSHFFSFLLLVGIRIGLFFLWLPGNHDVLYKEFTGEEKDRSEPPSEVH